MSSNGAISCDKNMIWILNFAFNTVGCFCFRCQEHCVQSWVFSILLIRWNMSLVDWWSHTYSIVCCWRKQGKGRVKFASDSTEFFYDTLTPRQCVFLIVSWTYAGELSYKICLLWSIFKGSSINFSSTSSWTFLEITRFGTSVYCILQHDGAFCVVSDTDFNVSVVWDNKALQHRPAGLCWLQHSPPGLCWPGLCWPGLCWN